MSRDSFTVSFIVPFIARQAKTSLALAVAATACLASPLALAQNRVNYSLGATASELVERESAAAAGTLRPSSAYRQVTNTRLLGSLPTGLDVNLKNGLYLGAWGSGMRWAGQNDLGGALGRSVPAADLDMYAGFRSEIAKKIWLDVGVQRFAGVGNAQGRADWAAMQGNQGLNEVYGAITWGGVTAKYSRNMANLFGSGVSAGSGAGAGFTPNSATQYIDLSANFDLGNGFSLAPRIGRQDINSQNLLAFTDYALTLGKTFSNGLSLTVTALGTQAGQSLYVLPGSDFTGRLGLAAGLKYAF